MRVSVEDALALQRHQLASLDLLVLVGAVLVLEADVVGGFVLGKFFGPEGGGPDASDCGEPTLAKGPTRSATSLRVTDSTVPVLRSRASR